MEEDLPLTAEQCIEELLAEPNRNILVALVKARRLIHRMKRRKNSGEIKLFVRQGVVQTVEGPDAQLIPPDE